MGNIFDGIQRPLKQIAVDSASCFIPRGVDVPALDRSLQWEFEPTQFKVGRARRKVDGALSSGVLLWDSSLAQNLAGQHGIAGFHVAAALCPLSGGQAALSPLWDCLSFSTEQVGDRITSGDIYGIVHENSLMEHKVGGICKGSRRERRHASTRKCGSDVPAGSYSHTHMLPSPRVLQVMLPPNARGNVSWIAPAGSYTIEDKVIEVEFGGVKKVRFDAPAVLSWACANIAAPIAECRCQGSAVLAHCGLAAAPLNPFFQAPPLPVLLPPTSHTVHPSHSCRSIACCSCGRCARRARLRRRCWPTLRCSRGSACWTRCSRACWAAPAPSPAPLAAARR